MPIQRHHPGRSGTAAFLTVDACNRQRNALAGTTGRTSDGGRASTAGNRLRDPEGILNLDIDQLSKVDVRTPAMNVEVTSVAKQESTVGKSAAAIYVMTSEMIHRSGCNNIPDLLRLVPGVEVARIDSHSWAITIRGFNNRYSDKLLVLMDGRTVYTPITAERVLGRSRRVVGGY